MTIGRIKKRIAYFVIFSLFCSIAVPFAPAIELQATSGSLDLPKKEAFYSFDGSSGKAQVVNRMGDLENGTNTGEIPSVDTVVQPAYVEGIHGKALGLDGSYGMKMTQINLGKSYTISFWVKAETEMENFTPILFVGNHFLEENDLHWLSITKSEPGGTPTIWSRTINENETGWPWYAHQDETGAWTAEDIFVSEPEWKHVILTVDSARGSQYGTMGKDDYYRGYSAKTYVDGELFGQGTVVKDIFENEADIYLGINPWDKKFKGCIDDLAFYKGSITAEQASALYQKAVSGDNSDEEMGEKTPSPSDVISPDDPAFEPTQPPDIELDLSNPVVEGDKTEWDTIYFGSYWQSDTNGDGTADQKDKKMPIKWRVLEINGTEALLLSDQCLDTQPYSDTGQFVRWAKSSLRNWLNTSFYHEAFSKEEQGAILYSQVNNNGNTEEYARDNDNTVDKVYLLSVEEIKCEQYGFPSDIKKNSESRVAINTEYARSLDGAWNNSTDNHATWLLRTPVAYYFVPSVASVSYYGQGAVFDGMHTPDTKSSIRPVIRVDLSNCSSWQYDTNFTNGDITVKTSSTEDITEEQLFRDYPEYLDKASQEKMMAEIMGLCSEVNGNRTMAENVYASAKYLLDDFNGIKTGVKWFSNKLLGTTSLSDEHLDKVTMEFLEKYCGKTENINKSVENAKSLYKKISDLKGNLKDIDEAKITILLSKFFKSKNEIKELSKELIKRWDKIDTIFKDAGYTIEFTEALTYVVMLEGIQEEIVADLLQEARQKNPDSTLCHGLERAYEKVKHPYLSVTEKYIGKGGFKFAADKIKDGAVNGMESLLNMMFKDPGSGGVVTLGNVILTLVSKIMPGADSDDVVQAHISTILLQDLESILDGKKTMFIKRKATGGEINLKEEISSYRLLYEARLTAAEKACVQAEKIAKKNRKKQLKEMQALLGGFSYENYIEECKEAVCFVQEAKYTYKKNGKDLAIGGGGGTRFSMRKYGKKTEEKDSDEDKNSQGKVVVIPDMVEGRSVTSIADGAFQGNEELETVIIPNGITEIGERAFCNCTSLKRVYIGKNVKSIGTGAFEGCNLLSLAEFKGIVSEISEDAFDQKELTLVTSPNGIVEQLAEEKGFSCELLDKAVKSIEIAKFPAKLTYSMGEELDETGMELAVTYEDGSGETITAGWSSVGYAENIGKTAIHVFYGGQKADYDISVEKGNLKYTINCVDEDGKYLGILEREGGFSEKVEVPSPEIDGYDCLDDSSEIALDDSDQQVTFTYKRNLDCSLYNAKVVLEQDSYNYTGEGIEPDLTVSLNDEELTKDIDYEVAYFNNIEKGKALILIFGIGKYNDMSAVDFSINQIKSPADDKNEADNNSKLNSSSSVSGDALNQALPIHKNKAKKLGKVKNLRVVNKKNRKFTAKWKKVKDAEGYQIQYALSKKKLSRGKRKNVKKASVTIKKLKKKKTYYVRVRAYKATGNKYVYGKWSAVKKIKIKK